MSARAPTATHRQSSSLISSPSSLQFTPCSAQARQASDRTMVMMAKTRDRTLPSGLSGDIPITILAVVWCIKEPPVSSSNVARALVRAHKDHKELQLLNTSTAFKPPNAKELDMANSTCAERASLGITSRSQA